VSIALLSGYERIVPELKDDLGPVEVTQLNRVKRGHRNYFLSMFLFAKRRTQPVILSEARGTRA
jgi:hypothetical protein